MDIQIVDHAGTFAENKDIARKIRLELVLPCLEKGNAICFDFSGVEGVTQSFIHALISDLFRKYGNKILDELEFKNCAPNVQKIILIVSDYMQEAL